jgi:hypothetical protein
MMTADIETATRLCRAAVASLQNRRAEFHAEPPEILLQRLSTLHLNAGLPLRKNAPEAVADYLLLLAERDLLDLLCDFVGGGNFSARPFRDYAQAIEDRLAFWVIVFGVSPEGAAAAAADLAPIVPFPVSG